MSDWTMPVVAELIVLGGWLAVMRWQHVERKMERLRALDRIGLSRYMGDGSNPSQSADDSHHTADDAQP